MVIKPNYYRNTVQPLKDNMAFYIPIQENHFTFKDKDAIKKTIKYVYTQSGM